MNTEYFNKMTSLGFLPYFLEMYYNKMQELNFSQAQAYEFFIAAYKENQQKGNITNVYDVINLAKNK
jgi:hypothetical protein